MDLPDDLWVIIYDYKREFEDFERWVLFWHLLFDNMVEGFENLFAE